MAANYAKVARHSSPTAFRLAAGTGALVDDFDDMKRRLKAQYLSSCMIILKSNTLGAAICVTLLCAAGCGKKESPPQKAESSSYPASVEPQAQAPMTAEVRTATPSSAAPTAGAAVVQSPAVVRPGSDMSAVLAQLTQAVRRYGAEKQKVPASLNEVLGAGYVQGTPQAPAGKKFAIDPKRLEVMLVNQ